MVAEANIAHLFPPTDALTDNLRKLMHERSISEAELARQTGIPQPTLHKILSGKTGDPRSSTLKSLADFFGISIDGLITGTHTQTHNGNNTQSIPVIDWNDTVNLDSCLSRINPANWSNWVVSEHVSNKAFALTSKPSLEPKFPKGSILILDPETAPEDGDLVLAYFKDSNSTSIRELSIDGPIRELTTICKPKNISTPCDQNIVILGVVIKAVFTFA